MKLRETHPSQFVSNFSPWHPVDATGGIESIITVSGITYRLHVFTAIGSNTLTINDSGSDGIVEYLVVGGGGGGGMDMGGGGGGGSVRSGRYNTRSGEIISITVGAGGLGAPGGSERRSDGSGPNPGGHQFTVSATNGGNSVFGPYTAIGGGYGGSSYFDYTPNSGVGASGASGGGTSGYSNGSTKLGAQGTAGQGFRGGQGGGQYYSGGGGGAGGQGADSTGQPNGGPGRLNNILGYDLYWGGGGGGAAYSLSTGGNGGIGGGGGGGVGVTTGGAGLNPGQGGGGGSPNSQTNTRGGNGGANTGGGGGGGSHYNATNSGGDGGSGIVVVRYPISAPLSPLEPVTSGIVLHLDANNINSYSGSGTTWNDLSGVMGNVNIQNRTTDWTFATSPEGVRGVYNATNRSANNSPGINVPTNNGFNKAAGTIDVWLRPLDSTGGYGIFVNSDGSTNTNASNWFWVGGWDSNTLLYFRQGNASTCCNDLTISRFTETYFITNKWNNFTFSWNVSTGSARIYVNGLLYASTTSIPTNVPNTNPTTTGQLFNGHTRGDNMQFKGYCSTYRIYNRQLSDAEILQNYDFSKQLHGH